MNPVGGDRNRSRPRSAVWQLPPTLPLRNIDSHYTDLIRSHMKALSLMKKESEYQGRIYVRPRAFEARGSCYNCGGAALYATPARKVGE